MKTRKELLTTIKPSMRQYLRADTGDMPDGRCHRRPGLRRLSRSFLRRSDSVLRIAWIQWIGYARPVGSIPLKILGFSSRAPRYAFVLSPLGNRRRRVLTGKVKADYGIGGVCVAPPFSYLRNS